MQKMGLNIFSSLILLFSFFYEITYTRVFAEIDPTVLNGILSKLAGENKNVSSTSTGSVNTNPPVTTLLTTNPTKTERFMIFSNSNGKVGEAMDVIVKAITKDGFIASGYTGTIFISVEKDYGATVPYIDGYTFTSSDQGVKTFPKGLSFSKAGIFKVTVSDIDEPTLVGSTSVSVSETEKEPEKIIPVIKVTQIKEPVVENSTTTVPTFKILKVETGDKRATFTFNILNDSPLIRKFQFTYTDPEGKSNKVLTYEKERIKSKNGEYVWYIPNLDLTKYIVSIVGVNANGETIEGTISESFEVDLSLGSAGKCIIPNVSGLRVLPKKDTSVLYWDSIPEAISYKIYKRNVNGDYVFIQETKNDSYTIYISNNSVRYDEFSVKAVCSDGTESLEFSPSTSVRTGPSEIILLALISALIGFIITRKRRQNTGKV
ncbi:MAG: hypothetical protein PHQ95_04685 [Candidatus Gracilibacteria bacterium]|nr:hypothetical protein [Candidatus Gracilibacteria bacterium]